MRVLTNRELNRAVLARQLLLERAEIPIPRALERMGGLQAQYAPSSYIGLWSRVARFERDDLTRALERRTVVQGTLMRATIHLVSARDYWPLAVAIRAALRAWWERTHARVSPREMQAAAKRLRPLVRERPLRSKELDELLGPLARGIGVYIELVRVPPSGTWDQRRADLYAAAEDWLGPPAIDEHGALERLVSRYLGAFGPATPNDVAQWAALPLTTVKSVLARVPLRRFRSEDGVELVDVPRAPLPDPETPAPVRFLPKWDATMLAHARRSGILPEKYRTRVANPKNLDIAPTFLVDGAVAGAWKYERGRVVVEPFHRLDRATRREVDEEAERLAALHA